MRSSWREGGIKPEEISIQESHGTGTALGDPIETGSCKATYKGMKSGLSVGAGKSHMGHLEACAGINGLLKVILSLTYAFAPPNVHLRTLNAHIETSGWPSFFTNELMDLSTEHHHGGANGFGFGGTNSRADFWCRRRHRVRDQAPRVLEGELFALDKTIPAKEQPKWLERLDYFTVVCEKCLGPMCWLCSAAVPDHYREAGAPGIPGRQHRCSAVRPETASYRYCSSCYDGSFYCEVAPASPAVPQGTGPPVEGLYITGTFSAWSTLEPMTVTEVPTEETVLYEGEFYIGDVRVEQFHLVWQKSDGTKLILHPMAKKASQGLRIAGPEEDSQGMHWLVDGRRDNAVEGQVYQVQFEWGPTRKRLSWWKTDKVLPHSSLFRHRYWMVDSLSGWLHSASGNPRPGFMTWEVGKPGLPPPYIPASGQVEFFILRDDDASQMIYPMSHRPKDDSVHVVGPDEGGDGKRFLASGEEGDQLRTWMDLNDGKWSSES
jgi:hypothetical protein